MGVDDRSVARRRRTDSARRPPGDCRRLDAERCHSSQYSLCGPAAHSGGCFVVRTPRSALQRLARLRPICAHVFASAGGRQISELAAPGHSVRARRLRARRALSGTAVLAAFHSRPARCGYAGHALRAAGRDAKQREKPPSAADPELATHILKKRIARLASRFATRPSREAAANGANTSNPPATISPPTLKINSSS